MAFDRTDTTLLGRWWWTIDRPIFAALMVLALIGGILVTAGSPAIAEKIGLESFYFVKRQTVFMILSLMLMLAISLFDPDNICRIAFIGFGVMLCLLMLVPWIGEGAKGAMRWISLGGFTIQPSEFMKPFFAVVCAWFFALGQTEEHFPGARVSMALYVVVTGLLLLQPDFGMAATVSAIWMGQFFLAGLPLYWVVLLGVLGLGGAVAAYFVFPHVADRVDRFLDPASFENYQVQKSLEALGSGGVLGKGPGEGVVKKYIPDAHTDFIFAVAGEEFGLLFSLCVIALFAFVVLRGFTRVSHDDNLFVMLATSGLLIQFGVQAIINIGVTLNLFPTKGMTLPFISYGGSSMLAFGIGMGMVLALTRKRYGFKENFRP